MNQIIFEGKIGDIPEIEDGGRAFILDCDFFNVSGHDDIFIKVQSFNDKARGRHLKDLGNQEHCAAKSLLGKKVRITIEEIE